MLNVIYVLVVAILVTGINLSALFTSTQPSIWQSAASAIFLVFWLLFSVYKGLNREQSFLKFATIFWLIGLAVSFSAVIDVLRPLAVASVFIFTGASYGLLYYVTDGFVGTQYIFLAIGIPFTLSIVGYFIGTVIGKVETTQKAEQ